MAAALIAVRAVRAALNTTSTGGLSVTSASSYATKSGVSKQKKTTSGGASASKPPPPATSKSAPLSGVGKNIDPPSNVFKKVETSQIGPGASKDKEYKNPEYFMYHNMSFCDMEEVMAKFRLPQPSSLKK